MTAPGDTRVTLALATSGGASRSSKTFRGASLAPRADSTFTLPLGTVCHSLEP
jgi:hypothetical protein